MKLYYDLHIHSALSPCGDNEMTPNNIVNMAAIKELDVIAITDHNSCKNAEACIKAAENAGLDLIVIAGMEVETAEEIHVVCLFPTIESAVEFDDFISENSVAIKNKAEIFGEQNIMDEFDNVTGNVDNLLVTATTLDLYAIVNKVKALSGVAVPAHIDRSSYSILSSLGFIPPDLQINLVEISKNTNPIDFINEKRKFLSGHNQFLVSSDAHRLEDISERNLFLEVNVQTKPDAATIINTLMSL